MLVKKIDKGQNPQEYLLKSQIFKSSFFFTYVFLRKKYSVASDALAQTHTNGGDKFSKLSGEFTN